MSAFTTAAALVKGAVLSTFGEKAKLYDTDKTTLLAQVTGCLSSRVEEPDEFSQISADIKMVKLDRAVAHLVKVNRYIEIGGRLYQFQRPADPAKFAGHRSGTEHFIYWYLI